MQFLPVDVRLSVPHRFEGYLPNTETFVADSRCEGGRLGITGSVGSRSPADSAASLGLVPDVGQSSQIGGAQFDNGGMLVLPVATILRPRE